MRGINKGGRPQKEVKREEEIKIRCTGLEKKVIQQSAKAANMQTAEYVRATALHQKISYKLTDDEIEIYKMLVHYRTNFSRIGNLLREQKSIQEEVKELVNAIDTHLKKII